jgi:hypothetical protein
MQYLGIASILLASVALDVAVRSHSSRFRAGVALALLCALVAGLTVVAVLLRFDASLYAAIPLWIRLACGVASVSSMGGVVAAGMRLRRENGEPERAVARRALRAWVLLALLEGATLVMAFAPGSDLILILLYAVTPVVVGVGALRLVKGHREDADIVRAEGARAFGLFALLLLPLELLAALFWFGGSNLFGAVYVVAMGAFVLLLPVATILLTGFRFPPVELARRPLTKEQSKRRVVLSLVALGSVAVLAVILSFARHFGSCAGVLVAVPEPKTAWRTLPIVAKGGQNSLGPFNVRGQKNSYKVVYPSVVQEARLSDPRLCFASTVSLEPWFDGRYGYALYRRVDELELRRDPTADTFIVSGNGYPTSDVATGFVVAFRRDETKRYMFDHPEAKRYLAFAAGFLAVGSVALAFFRSWKRRPPVELEFVKPDRSSMLALVSYVAFLAALVTPMLLAFVLIDAPRPGNELVIHVIPP